MNIEDLGITNSYFKANASYGEVALYTAFNEGVSETIQKLTKWLWQPCCMHWCEAVEEDFCVKFQPGHWPEHRYLCPSCMKELENIE